MRAISCRLWASTTAPRHQLVSAVTQLSADFPESQLTSQIWASKFGSNSMMTPPYSHPQHMKVVNHLVCDWSYCGSHFMWVSSLNHCNMASFLKSGPTSMVVTV
jgi:hypothetical protein